MKCYLIDVTKQEIRVVDVKQGIADIYRHIGNDCQTFECPIMLENGDSMYIDGMGVYKPQAGGIIMKDWVYPLAGNVLIQGTDEMGEGQDAQSDLDWLYENITFVGPGPVEAQAEKARESSPQIFIFKG